MGKASLLGGVEGWEGVSVLRAGVGLHREVAGRLRRLEVGKGGCAEPARSRE